MPVLHNNTLYVAKSPHEPPVPAPTPVPAPVPAAEKPATAAIAAADRPRKASGASLPDHPPAEVLPAIRRIIAEQTGYTEDMLEPDLDLEADLGIDTVKQVEVFGRISAHFELPVPEDLKLGELNTIARLADYIGRSAGPAAAPADAAPVADGAAEVLPAIRRIIAEQTGYTEDMLEPDLDLEADLGIDTVKQVEVFGRISAHFELPVPEDLKLGELNTIARLADYIGRSAGPAAAPADAAPVADGAAEVLPAIRRIIAEQTGYTEDMLEPDLDLEADLGIDTVKQVEVFGRISAHFELPVPEDLKLGELNTIARLADYIGRSAGPAAAPADTAPGADGAAEVLPAIRRIIAEQTGYTEDMLEPDLDLEADLGIDTVKQVEVFGRISAHFELPVPEDLKLGELNTIARLADYIGRSAGDARPVAVPDRKKPESEAAAPASGVRRFVVQTRTEPLTDVQENIFRDRTFVVTTDRFGFAEAVRQRIESFGGRVLTVGRQDTADVQVDLADPAAVGERLAALVADVPEIRGLIHLRPLDGCFADRGADGPEIDASVKSFFLMVQHLQPLLEKPDGLISVLALESVVFPYADAPADVHPVFAALGGMLKTLNKEMAATRVKMVDFAMDDPLADVAAIADRYTAELMSSDRRVETGFKGDRKYTLGLVNRPPEKTQAIVKKGDTILVTGGARGITFEILKALTDQYQPHLVILGRSDIDALDADFKAAHADEAYIFGQLKARMPGAKPVDIKRAVGKRHGPQGDDRQP